MVHGIFPLFKLERSPRYPSGLGEFPKEVISDFLHLCRGIGTTHVTSSVTTFQPRVFLAMSNQSCFQPIVVHVCHLIRMNVLSPFFVLQIEINPRLLDEIIQ
jgi:hypothetical protein